MLWRSCSSLGLRPALEELGAGAQNTRTRHLRGDADAGQPAVMRGQLPGLNWVPGRVKAFAQHPDLQNTTYATYGLERRAVSCRASVVSLILKQRRAIIFCTLIILMRQDKADVVATAEYGIDFDCIVSRGNVHGIQCHPEKSHRFGAQFLKNFAEL
jgi:glutamine amidotransferase